MHHSELPLWDHQREALEFIRSRPAALLAMDMGTGKSRCVVEAVRGLWQLTAFPRVLIVCPKSVLPVWTVEFEKYLPPEAKVKIVNTDKLGAGTKVKVRKLQDLLGLSVGIVVTINYESMRQPAMVKFLSGITWDLIVADESHRAKNATSKTAKALTSIPGRQRLALTGTPMPHSPLDIFGQFRFLRPQIFGRSFVQFRNRYAVMGGYRVNGRPVQVMGYTRMSELELKVASITYRCKADDVLDLPDRHHVSRWCELPAKAASQYESLDKDFVTWVDSGKEVVATNVLAKLTKLMQFTSGHVRIEDDTGESVVETVHSAKQDSLIDLLTDLPWQEPVVVFALYRPDLDAIDEAARKAGRECLELSGRKNELGQWQEKRSGQVIAVQLQAGGVGITLVRARHCVYYSTGFNLGDYEQSLARVHRPGQTRKVTYHHLMVRGSVDEKAFYALRARKNLVQEVMTHVESHKTQ